MSHTKQPLLRAAVNSSKAALACLALLLVFTAQAQADTLNIIGSSGSASPPPSVSQAELTALSRRINVNFLTPACTHAGVKLCQGSRDCRAGNSTVSARVRPAPFWMTECARQPASSLWGKSSR